MQQLKELRHQIEPLTEAEICAKKAEQEKEGKRNRKIHRMVLLGVTAIVVAFSILFSGWYLLYLILLPLIGISYFINSFVIETYQDPYSEYVQRIENLLGEYKFNGGFDLYTYPGGSFSLFSLCFTDSEEFKRLWSYLQSLEERDNSHRNDGGSIEHNVVSKNEVKIVMQKYFEDLTGEFLKADLEEQTLHYEIVSR